MPVHADASTHFHIRDIVVTLGDRDFTVPGLPASRWLTILAAPEVDGTLVLPGMLSLDDQRAVDDLLLTGQLSVKEIGDAVRDVVTIASGHPWWWSLGLISLLRSEQGTQLLGEMTRINPEKVPLAAWLNALYALCVKWQRSEDRAQFDAELDNPPPGTEVDPEEVIDEAASSSAFMSMMRSGSG